MTQLPNPFIPANATPELANPFMPASESTADDHRFVLDEAAFMAALQEPAANRAPAFISDPSADYLKALAQRQDGLLFEPRFAPIFALLRAA